MMILARSRFYSFSPGLLHREAPRHGRPRCTWEDADGADGSPDFWWSEEGHPEACAEACHGHGHGTGACLNGKGWNSWAGTWELLVRFFVVLTGWGWRNLYSNDGKKGFLATRHGEVQLGQVLWRASEKSVLESKRAGSINLDGQHRVDQSPWLIVGGIATQKDQSQETCAYLVSFPTWGRISPNLGIQKSECRWYWFRFLFPFPAS